MSNGEYDKLTEVEESLIVDVLHNNQYGRFSVITDEGVQYFDTVSSLTEYLKDYLMRTVHGIDLISFEKNNNN